MGSGRAVRERNTKHQTSNTREIPESKHQKPSSKHQRNPKFQTPNRGPRFELGTWSLELLWCLELGFWCFNSGISLELGVWDLVFRSLTSRPEPSLSLSRPSSVVLSPLLPRRERGHFSDGGCIKIRPAGRPTGFYT